MLTSQPENNGRRALSKGFRSPEQVWSLMTPGKHHQQLYFFFHLNSKKESCQATFKRSLSRWGARMTPWKASPSSWPPLPSCTSWSCWPFSPRFCTHTKIRITKQKTAEKIIQEGKPVTVVFKPTKEFGQIFRLSPSTTRKFTMNKERKCF